MFSSKYLICSATLLFAGCAKPIADDAIKSANYGPPPPSNYQSIIKRDFAQTLIDPTAPLYTFGKPKKGYTQESSMFGTHEAFGWRVCGTINSKNRFGGYVGNVPFFVLFRHGQIIEKVTGEITDNQYGINLKNSAIENACAR